MLNIGSYMGGVDLWQNEFEHDDDFNHQSMHDKILEVVCVSGAWHLGKLQVWRVSLCFHFYLLIKSASFTFSPFITASVFFYYLTSYNPFLLGWTFSSEEASPRGDCKDTCF